MEAETIYVSGVAINTNWIIAIATVVYTIGTFALWLTTLRSLKATREAFKLNFVMALYELRHQPADDAPAPIRQAIEMSSRDKTFDRMKRVFPREYKEFFS